MKFLITGDWHIDKDRIKTRKDSVFETCIDKLTQILKIAHGAECDALLQPGDFFESHKANDFIKQEIIKLLKGRYRIDIYTVFGQHDLRYHSSNTLNTPLKVLDSAECVHILSDSKNPTIYPQSKVYIHGASWFEDIPEIDERLKGTHILVLHKMIVNTKLWEGQEDHIYGKILLKKTKFDLIVSGDNHQHFIIHSGHKSSIGKRLLVNCGSLLRTRIDQRDHKPCVYIYNTKPSINEPVLEQVFLKIKDFDDVIYTEKAERIKEENEKLNEFVKALSKDRDLTGMNYKRNVYEFLENNKKNIDDGTRKFIDTVFSDME